jgi:hypothetical protein
VSEAPTAVEPSPVSTAQPGVVLQGAKGASDVAEGRAQPKRRVSKRLEYVGRTPGKGTRTGREVIERMKNEGKLREAEDGSLAVQDRHGTWVKLNETDMGHLDDAVEYWNREGYKYGPKADEVRKWMLDPKNYELEPSSQNRSRGAQLRVRYRPPEKRQ